MTSAVRDRSRWNNAGAVGASIPRVDGVDKVTGRAIYVDDIHAPDALCGATVRSQVAHGALRAIELDPGYDWSGVVVATAADVPGENTIALIEADQPALVPIGGTIRHHGEAVALVAAPTRRRAREAAARVRLVVDELPAALSIDDALAGSVLLHGDDNAFASLEIHKGAGGGDVEAALAGADFVVDCVYHTGAQEQMYIEPQGMIARWPGDGTVRITGSMQCPYYVHKAMVRLLGLAPEDVVIAQAVTGGGFGGKEEYPSMIAAHAALLSRAAGRPVKLIYDRDEDIAATTKRHPARVRHRLGVNADGTIRAIDVDVVLDGGAYVTLSPVVLSRAILHAAGPYRCDTIRVRGRVVATNTPPHGAFRGFGAPQTTFAYERQAAKAAARLGMSQLAFCRLNALRPGDTTATGQRLEHSVGSLAVLDAVEHAWSAPPVDASLAPDDASPEWAAADSPGGGGGRGPAPRRGRGMAFYYHGAGFTGSGEQRLAGRATVALIPDGRFEVRSSSTDIGQGTLTIFSQIAGAALGVDPDRVAIAEASTDGVPDSGPTVASRTCMVVGRVVERAALALRARIEAWAAGSGLAGKRMEDLAELMAFDVGEVSETAQYAPPPGIEWDDATYTGSAYPVYGWAACVVDVAVDPDTYEVAIERCVHAVDVGKAIHPIIVKGQIEGGTLQALGWATIESVVYDRGRVANANMTNCIVPTSADAPELETILVEEPYPHGPHGAKGVGEIPMDGPAAAVATAISNALGVDVDEVPALPERIERLAPWPASGPGGAGGDPSGRDGARPSGPAGARDGRQP